MYISALTWTGMVELNSIFLHIRKLMRVGGVDQTRTPYRWAVRLNLLSFVMCRHLLLLFLIYRMSTYGITNQSHPWLHLFLILVCMLLFGLSVTFFRMLIRSDLLVALNVSRDSGTAKLISQWILIDGHLRNDNVNRTDNNNDSQSSSSSASSDNNRDDETSSGPANSLTELTRLTDLTWSQAVKLIFSRSLYPHPNWTLHNMALHCIPSHR